MAAMKEGDQIIERGKGRFKNASEMFDDLDMLSKTERDRLAGQQELYGLLDEGMAAMKEGRHRPAKEVFADIEKEFGFK